MPLSKKKKKQFCCAISKKKYLRKFWYEYYGIKPETFAFENLFYIAQKSVT